MFLRQFYLKAVIISMLALMAVAVDSGAQPFITHADGSPLATEWCYEDRPVAITAIPEDGIFTGCGITSANGKWYFNPAFAGTGARIFPLLCRIRYFAPDGDSAVLDVRIHKPVIPDAGPPLVSCSGMFTLGVTMLYAGDYSYSWSPAADLGNPIAKETGGRVADSQMFYVRVRDTLTGCEGTDSVRAFNRSVRAAVSAERAYACKGDSILISAAYRDSSWRYRWDMGDGYTASGDSVRHLYAGSGLHTIMLIAENNDCADTSMYGLEVESLDLELHGPERTEPGAYLNLETYAPQTYRIETWAPAALFPGQEHLSQYFIPDTTREYTVFGVSDKGCRDSASVFVIVNPVTYLPTAFSPNGDGRNDRFRLVTRGEPSQIRIFRIFDRWGKQVYAAAGNAADAGWDGGVNGLPAEIGTYFYAIEFESGGRHFAVSGEVTLMR